ncbi:uncharacterized protein LOC142238460 [Haematobia irritans]|uniref:uncharacterized protein LOC142238460 n=1 Tax=Haematobia irritans TaxID=7368 RepID=UPI003F506A23
MAGCGLLCTLVYLIALGHLITVLGQYIHSNHINWFESHGILYHIEVASDYSWKDARLQCKNQGLNLLKVSAEYDLLQLKEYIREKFPVTPNFWIHENTTKGSFMEHIGIHSSRGEDERCNMLENQTFVLKTEKCYKSLGFICERSLRNGYSTYQLQNTRYLIDSRMEYTCEEAKQVCSLQNATLTSFTSYKTNYLLKDYIYLNFGAHGSFLFGKSNSTTNNATECYPWGPLKGSDILVEKHGFVCERLIEVKPAISFRHLVLIGVVSSVALIAVIVFIALKLMVRSKMQNLKLKESAEKSSEKK